MTVNIFRPVSDTVVLPHRIIQGKPWRNISFGKNASIAIYAKHGLYLEVGEKPTHSIYQEARLVQEVIDHTTKQVELQWEIVDLSPERIAAIDEAIAKKDENENGTLANITIAQGDAWIQNNVTDLPSAKIAMKKLLRLILART